MAFVLDAGDVRDTPVPEIEQIARRRRRTGLVVGIDTVDSRHLSRNADHRDGLGERAHLNVGQHQRRGNDHSDTGLDEGANRALVGRLISVRDRQNYAISRAFQGISHASKHIGEHLVTKVQQVEANRRPSFRGEISGDDVVSITQQAGRFEDRPS